jgi:phosphoenolpyruvate---glycerone phosphotransferase subunit DhaL
MSITPALIPEILRMIEQSINENAEQVTELDQAIGDGDHVANLQRGLAVLHTQAEELATLDWPSAWKKIAMTVMTNVGGASGSLYATLFLSLSKSAAPQSRRDFSEQFALAIDAVKQRGKADIGEKTMLDVWIPVADSLKSGAEQPLPEALQQICATAETGVESTRNLLATKGRASFLGERSLGHIDAGAKTAQLMVDSIANALLGHTSF